MGWVGLTVVLFVALLIATLWLASQMTIAIGIGSPEREHFALLQTLLFGASMMVTVPLAGRLLGQARLLWPGLVFAVPSLLAAVASYLIFEDVRSGEFFETDHALPEIFVPMAIVLLGSAQVGHRVAADAVARRAWSWFGAVASGILLALVGLTVEKARLGLGGAWSIDSALTFVALAVAAAYAVVAVAGSQAIAQRRR